MAQGQGLSLLLRAHRETANRKYLDAAQQVIATFHVSTNHGGVTFTDRRGDVWFEAASRLTTLMDLASHRVRRNGREVHLGPTEFRLLRHLLENQGRVFSREQLLDMVWGRDVYVEPRTVDVHIRRLRKAINNDKENDLIRTVRAAGYALDYAN